MNRDNPKREFSWETKKQEAIDAKYKCRICREKKNNGSIFHSAHIYSYSLSEKWKREGTINNKWKDDKYVSSKENCLYLCIHHHLMIDSVEGLYKCNVQYLLSLKNISSGNTCTALVKNENDDTKYRRCRNKIKCDSYRCHKHVQGGIENTFEPRKNTIKFFESNYQNQYNTTKNKDKQCIII
jgi:hypothetical protein